MTSSKDAAGTPSEKLRVQRERIGLTVAEAARQGDVSSSEYDHIESDPRELYMTTPLRKVNRICIALGLKLHEVYGLEPCRKSVGHDIVAIRRQELGLTISQLAAAVGIDVGHIAAVERNAETLSDWVMDPVLDLATTLQVQPACLLAWVKAYSSRDN